MNEKEVAEIRRRYKAEKHNITKIRGCYVNEKGEILAQFTQSIHAMQQDESDSLLSILKKTLSGSIGKNLLNLEFSNDQIIGGDEHKTLMALRDSRLEDDEAVNKTFERITKSLNFEGTYLVLLCCDKYDVFTYSKDGEKSEDSGEMFTYILCSVCPVKLTKPALSYLAFENAFQNISANSVIAAPEVGFMFPSFDDRASNIYNTLMYTKNTAASYDEFTKNLFDCEMPMPAAIQKETFDSIFSDTISEACNLDVVQSVHDNISSMIQDHKAAKEEQPLMLSKHGFSSVLRSSGVLQPQVDAFEEKYDFEFGEDTEISPQNIVNTNQFELKTADVTIKVNPERSDLVKTQVINGTKYIMIRADQNVEVNGININITE